METKEADNKETTDILDQNKLEENSKIGSEISEKSCDSRGEDENINVKSPPPSPDIQSDFLSENHQSNSVVTGQSNSALENDQSNIDQSTVTEPTDNYETKDKIQISAELQTCDSSDDFVRSQSNEDLNNKEPLKQINSQSNLVLHSQDENCEIDDRRPENQDDEEDLGVYVDMDEESNVSDIGQSLNRTESSNNETKSESVAQLYEETKSKTESRIQFQDTENMTRNKLPDENIREQRIKVNSPVSHVTEDGQHIEPRQLESREATYQQAMSLLSTRCTSTQQENGYGVYIPEYFYIHQKQPTPMPPLKVWRGYHGNVYFEPITINRLQQNQTSTLPHDRCSNRNHQMLLDRSRMSSRSRIKPRQLSSSPQRPVTQQLVILDRNTVLSKFSEYTLEDLLWLEGQDSTGSLSIRPQTVCGRRMPVSSKFDRICKGSVARKLNEVTKKKHKPDIKIMGDKFVHPSAMSPLLRSTTQYSLSNQRNQNNSPDLYHRRHGNPDHLPPVEQVRVSLRHIDNSLDKYGRMSPYTRSAKYTSDPKPFIKYSPEIKAKFGKRLASMT